MLSKKAYCFAGKWLKSPLDRLFILFGFIGASILVFSLFMVSPQKGYVLGSFLMLLMAIHFKLAYFIALESILIAGHMAIILGMGPIVQAAIPVLLSLQLIIYYIWTRQLNNIYRIIGIFGISILSIGFAYNNDMIFLLGSFSIAIYSLYSALKGIFPCYIWLLLNLIFAFDSLINII